MVSDIVVESIDVDIEHAGTRDEYLNAAVEALQVKAADRGRCGILVTRHMQRPGHYTVELSSDVPHGLTYESSV